MSGIFQCKYVCLQPNKDFCILLKQLFSWLYTLQGIFTGVVSCEKSKKWILRFPNTTATILTLLSKGRNSWLLLNSNNQRYHHFCPSFQSLKKFFNLTILWLTCWLSTCVKYCNINATIFRTNVFIFGNTIKVTFIEKS